MGIALTVLIGSGLIGFVLFLTRETWFSAYQKKGARTASTPPPTSTTAEKKETAKTKESPGSVWKFFRPILGFALVVLVLLLGFGAFRHFFLSNDTTQSSIKSRTSISNLSHGVPAEIALRLIADCESGDGTPGSAHHFKADGMTLLRNREGSTAIGKYQILASLHAERAKGLGIDINTEEGNEAYARILYQESGTRHWEADSRSVACWEPKLRRYASGRGEETTLVVIAPTDKFSDTIPLPLNGDMGGRHSLDGFGKKYIVRWNNGRPDEVEEDLPRPKGAVKKTPEIVYDFSLKSRETEAVPITVKFF